MTAGTAELARDEMGVPCKFCSPSYGTIRALLGCCCVALCGHPECRGSDVELEDAKASYDGRWFVQRMPRGALQASLEPTRAHHVLGFDRADLDYQITEYKNRPGLRP